MPAPVGDGASDGLAPGSLPLGDGQAPAVEAPRGSSVLTDVEAPAGPDADPLHESGPRLSVAAVARRLGIAPATLRTWDRRYGLGPSQHAAGAHRRYAAADLARLETMRRLTLEGVPPSEAARVALDAPAAEPVAARSRPGGPGGRVLPMPGVEAVVRGLGRAAMALDSRAVTSTVRTQVAEHGVVRTWENVLRPVLAAAGARWAVTGDGIEVEHLLSDCVVTVLREVATRAPEPGRPVLLACAPDELHVLPLHAVAAGLGERGIGARVLGAAMPASAIEAAVRRTGPAALFLWSQLPGTADPGVLHGLPATRPATALAGRRPGVGGGERAPAGGPRARPPARPGPGREGARRLGGSLSSALPCCATPRTAPGGVVVLAGRARLPATTPPASDRPRRRSRRTALLSGLLARSCPSRPRHNVPKD